MSLSFRKVKAGCSKSIQARVVQGPNLFPSMTRVKIRPSNVSQKSKPSTFIVLKALRKYESIDDAKSFENFTDSLPQNQRTETAETSALFSFERYDKNLTNHFATENSTSLDVLRSVSHGKSRELVLQNSRHSHPSEGTVV